MAEFATMGKTLHYGIGKAITTRNPQNRAILEESHYHG
jgi:hypothetical protein